MGNGNATFFDLCRCLRGQPPREGADWVSVVKLAKRSLTTPALHEFAARYSAQLPDDLHAYLKEQFARNLLRNHRLMKQLLEAIRALNGAGISPMLIKGAALLASRPSRMGHRIMADLDIVVDPKQTKSGLQCLLRLGYRVNSGDLDDPTVHYVAVERANEVGQIDLHKRPPGPSYFFQVTNIKDNCIPLTNLGSSAVVPSSTCQALILINHDQFHDEGRLVAAPNVVLRLVGEMREYAGVIGEIIEHPRRRGACRFAELDGDIERHLVVMLVTTPPFGLQRVQQTGADIFLDQLARKVAVAFGLDGALAQFRRQRARAAH